jgi:hypothetical protein
MGWDHIGNSPGSHPFRVNCFENPDSPFVVRILFDCLSVVDDWRTNDDDRGDQFGVGRPCGTDRQSCPRRMDNTTVIIQKLLTHSLHEAIVVQCLFPRKVTENGNSPRGRERQLENLPLLVADVTLLR